MFENPLHLAPAEGDLSVKREPITQPCFEAAALKGKLQAESPEHDEGVSTDAALENLDKFLLDTPNLK